MAVLVALVISAMSLCAVLLVRTFDAQTQTRLQAHQTLEADLWARMLTARMEAHQRLLTSIAQGMHTSLLDKPAVLDALMQQDGSMLRLFESLHVALPSGSVSHHGAVGAAAEIDVPGVDALRRTIAEGKPFITHLPITDDNQHLHVLLSVPMRQDDGTVSGALAAMVKLPLAALMPQASTDSPVQYMVLDSDGLVLVHSDEAQRWKNIKDLVGPYGAQWQALSQPSAMNADTQQWGTLLTSRVGLPLPQWQVVILRDMSADLMLQQGVPLSLWGTLAVAGMALTALAAWLLWGWLAPWPHRERTARVQDVAAEPADAAQAQVRAADGPALMHGLPVGAMAMLQAVPSAMLLEQKGQITQLTPQASSILGYWGAAETFPSFDTLCTDAHTLAQVRSSLVELGSFEGNVTWRKKDGDTVVLAALAWTPAQPSDVTVWRLQLPWRQPRSMPLPEQEHAWCDALTGLPNREAFLWGLQSWISDSMPSEKKRTPLRVPVPAQGCVLFVDLDHLGMMNETTSRNMGNHLLRHVGRLMADYVQPLGDVARLGGDEFAVLLPGVSLVHAQAIGQALCDAVWQWQPSWEGERHWVSISIGIVAVDALRHTPQQALRAADMACYEAKRRGRCQVAVGQISAHPVLQA